MLQQNVSVGLLGGYDAHTMNWMRSAWLARQDHELTDDDFDRGKRRRPPLVNSSGRDGLGEKLKSLARL
jgi:hypothetical protein